VLLWALTREIRAMAALAEGRDPGIRMPPQRLNALRQHAGRLGGQDLAGALAQAAHVDRAIKGGARMSPWQGLASLVMRLSGRPLPEVMER